MLTNPATMEYMRIRIEAMEKQIEKLTEMNQKLIEEVKKTQIDLQINNLNNGKTNTQD
tara:strand:+ start:195 stop:368 length:174 start_codon:yes stop_codon:yes gene_type:complete